MNFNEKNNKCNSQTEHFQKLKKKTVNYYVKFIGKSDCAIQNGKIYKCVGEYYRNGELFTLSVIDDTEEYYQYSPKAFEKVT